MRIRRRARLDPSQVSDRRGMSGSPIAIGGGAIGLVVAVILLLVNGFSGGSTDTGASGAGDLSSCQTGADAQQSQDCAVVAYVNSIQDYWSHTLPGYTEARTVLFTDRTQTGCGTATTAVGPFYCPEDQKVYLDLSFFQELQQRFGAPGEFAQAYVIAHEIGHHVQKLLGIEPKIHRLQERNPAARNQLSVRLELQADCLAGVWGHSTEQRKIVNETDVAQGINAAAAVGDDRLQRMARGRVSPESFTHGSSAQRTEWFKRGLESGQVSACDTFAAR